MSTGGAAGGAAVGIQRSCSWGAAVCIQWSCSWGAAATKDILEPVVAAGAAVMKIQWRCSRGSNEEEDATALEQGAAAREIR